MPWRLSEHSFYALDARELNAVAAAAVVALCFAVVFIGGGCGIFHFISLIIAAVKAIVNAFALLRTFVCVYCTLFTVAGVHTQCIRYLLVT